jgi:hypothetical protein
MLVTPSHLAAELLVVLKPGRQQWRGVLSPDVRLWLDELEQLAGRAPLASAVAKRAPTATSGTPMSSPRLSGALVRSTSIG